jgi:hypothetical protein
VPPGCCTGATPRTPRQRDRRGSRC